MGLVSTLVEFRADEETIEAYLETIPKTWALAITLLELAAFTIDIRVYDTFGDYFLEHRHKSDYMSLFRDFLEWIDNDPKIIIG